ncbi:MAG: NUDIX domain-containing protein [Rhodospirillum sp.]|nr:NUDIX domain-containing protein [Rhodospirillum sp.]MCF8491509.1 NUDIX domain-containing protein [Rhodospirillum sp.]
MATDVEPRERVQILSRETLSDDWGVLTKYEIDYRRRDGTVQRLSRETYDRGHGATILLYNRDKGTVILTRQFRLPVHMAGGDADLIETCAGLLDFRDPESAIRAEAEEETGVRVGAVQLLWEAYMSPGSVTERLHFFVAPYSSDMRLGAGGGRLDEGEDITVLEIPLSEALAKVERGEIRDGKTIMLLQHAALKGLCEPVAP